MFRNAVTLGRVAGIRVAVHYTWLFADLIVDFRPYRGQRLTLVNTAGAPFDGSPAAGPPGTPDPANRLPDADALQFRVARRTRTIRSCSRRPWRRRTGG